MAQPDPGAMSTEPGGEDGYTGPARLTIGHAAFEVEVRLRGHFQPIDGRYHWRGRIAAHDGVAGQMATGRADGVLSTAEGDSGCEISEPDPWGRYRVAGISTPPFAAALAGGRIWQERDEADAERAADTTAGGDRAHRPDQPDPRQRSRRNAG